MGMAPSGDPWLNSFMEFVNVTNQYTAVVKQDGNWWIGWIEEVPGVNCQERTYEALRETLVVTLREALEFNRQEAIAAAGTGYREEKISV
jgi:predicted RNase H-like HicB family nuclease